MIAIVRRQTEQDGRLGVLASAPPHNLCNVKVHSLRTNCKMADYYTAGTDPEFGD